MTNILKTGDYDESVWAIILSQVRHAEAKCHRLLVISTPDGLDWVGERWNKLSTKYDTRSFEMNEREHKILAEACEENGLLKTWLSITVKELAEFLKEYCHGPECNCDSCYRVKAIKQHLNIEEEK